MNKEVVAHTYNGILLSHKKEENWISSSKVDEPKDRHMRELSQKEKSKYWYINTHIYKIEKKKDTDEPICRAGIEIQL